MGSQKGKCRSTQSDTADPLFFFAASTILRPMCGRFDNLIARDAYRGLFEAHRLPKSNFPLRYNIAPTDQIPIVRIDPRDGRAGGGDGALGAYAVLDEGEAEVAAYQCTRRDCGQAAAVSRG